MNLEHGSYAHQEEEADSGPSFRVERLSSPEERLRQAIFELRPDLADVHPVNVGEPPIKGFREAVIGGVRREKEKPLCEDRKINDPKNGLFAVADGVSTGMGAIAAEAATLIVQERLGATLSSEILEYRAAHRSQEEIDAVVRDQMAQAFIEANALIYKLNLEHREYHGSSTTLTVVRTVPLVNGRTRVYVASVGDSRVYVSYADEGSLIQLTKDDSRFEDERAHGAIQMSDAEADALDQFVRKEALTKEERQYIGMRNVITEAVGFAFSGKATALTKEDICFIDLSPGDRLLLTTDGVHDNALRSEMQEVAHRAHTTRQVEHGLQTLASRIQRDPNNDRRKPDDAAAVVHEIPSVYRRISPYL